MSFQGRPIVSATCETTGAPAALRLSAVRGTLVAGTGNGDPSNLQIETEPTRRPFSGPCQVIPRTRAGETGKARLVAEADGVRSAQLDFTLG